MINTEMLVIGGGLAGLAAAEEAAKMGVRVCLVEREHQLGGILRQCLHHGFGCGQTGPEYIGDFFRGFPQSVDVLLGATVTSIDAGRTAVLRRANGEEQVHFEQCILATGAYEVPFGALGIAGTRPEGIMSAGRVQKMVHLEGTWPEEPVVILGAGDLGLIMAATLAEHGLGVTVVEREEKVHALARNQEAAQLEKVRLILGQSITYVHGEAQLSAVELSSGEGLDCRTLAVAVGLASERTLAKDRAEPWLHFAGNCEKIYPMVEGVIESGRRSARHALGGEKND